jgi:hypothetical protein
MINTEQKATADRLFAAMLQGWMAARHGMPDDASSASFADKAVASARLLTETAKVQKAHRYSAFCCA